ncbi:hypothetical protein L5515_006249 [Caenorhabditis briggsae]|uniref:Uncharacterized protein n=1 Tax=Caenorhabditis briggsae TaxID=6238 RepID=A0AAE9JIK3_CAEBR|nr:hypothetical protein L5515_006249 [Caenorhabditis briggsae]
MRKLFFPSFPQYVNSLFSVLSDHSSSKQKLLPCVQSLDKKTIAQPVGWPTDGQRIDSRPLTASVRLEDGEQTESGRTTDGQRTAYGRTTDGQTMDGQRIGHGRTMDCPNI